MYASIKQDIQKPYYQQNFSNDGARFVAWYLRIILSRDFDVIKYDITDGEDDKQIDAIVMDEENSTIYIIQGKFITSNKLDSGPVREVLSSWIH